jgi:anti-anti-sigma regulatory factor
MYNFYIKSEPMAQNEFRVQLSGNLVINNVKEIYQELSSIIDDNVTINVQGKEIESIDESCAQVLHSLNQFNPNLNINLDLQQEMHDQIHKAGFHSIINHNAS